MKGNFLSPAISEIIGLPEGDARAAKENILTGGPEAFPGLFGRFRLSGPTDDHRSVPDKDNT
jgi:hypothetical protein